MGDGRRWIDRRGHARGSCWDRLAGDYGRLAVLRGHFPQLEPGILRVRPVFPVERVAGAELLRALLSLDPRACRCPTAGAVHGGPSALCTADSDTARPAGSLLP